MVIVVLVIAVLLVLAASIAHADSENAAIVIKIDDVCGWGAPYGDEGLFAQGDVYHVQTSNGTWKLSCKSDAFVGPSLDAAVIIRSTPDDPIGLCWTPLGATYTWQMVFTPGRQSSLSCHGDVTP